MAGHGNQRKPPSRRELLRGAGSGIAGLSLLSALERGGLFAAPSAALDPLAPRPPHFPARAKNVIFLFLFGGPSQMDLFDYKPELQKRDGQTVQIERRRGQFCEATILGSQRRWRRWGETGQWCSDAFRHIPRVIDEFAVVKSLYTDSFAHGSAVLQLNSGQIFQGHPAMGSWITYGLGSENPDLPGFVVMHDPRGGPISGPRNWSNGYMPASYQGTLFRATGVPLLDMEPDVTSPRVALTEAMERRELDLLTELDRHHREDRAAFSELAARERSYDQALRMRAAAPEALDLSTEDERTLELYGFQEPRADHPLALPPAVFGRQCLIARRLVERGVRFVQIYHGGGHQQQTWDAHHGVEENLAIHCPEVDRPIAGLIADLRQRGLLEETLVLIGGEFGRQPVAQQAGNGQVAADGGRDHNPKALTMLLAGGGVRPGPFGETDELGAEAATGRRHIRDLHATVLHLLGLDHERLVYRHTGLDRRFTGVIEASPIREIMA